MLLDDMDAGNSTTQPQVAPYEASALPPGGFCTSPSPSFQVPELSEGYQSNLEDGGESKDSMPLAPPPPVLHLLSTPPCGICPDCGPLTSLSSTSTGMQARLKTRLSCRKGPPPDAVHMSSKLANPEPVQTTQKLICSSRHPRHPL